MAAPNERSWNQPQLWVEVFAILNIGFLTFDIYYRVYTQADMDGLRAMVQRDAESFKIKLPLAGREPEGGVQLNPKTPRVLCKQGGKQMERRSCK